MMTRRTVRIDGRPAELAWEQRNGDVVFRYSRPGEEGAERRASVVMVEPGVYSVLVEGRSYEVKIAGAAVALQGERFLIEVVDPRSLAAHTASATREGRQAVKAPMPGKVIRVLVAEGDQITAGQGVAVVEAMKMQNELKAPKDGRIVSLRARQGDTVALGDVLAEIE
jgi:biotin carboxyl carrier protein